MANKNIDLLIKRIRNSVEDDEGERFCFILGSGASRNSGIPSGGELEYKWMEELLGDPLENDYKRKVGDVGSKARELLERKRMKHGFDDIKKHWEAHKNNGKKSLDGKYYFDIFELHEYFTQKDGQRDIERRFEEKKEDIAPSRGYAVLAKLLTGKDRNGVVVTTNFDNLVEQALSLTQVSPIVINHEALATVVEELVPDCRYPIIGKIHRGIGYGIKNSNEDTGDLPKSWEDALGAVFRYYTPIVIGYSGEDNSLMTYLEKHTFNRGIIWCVHESANDRVQTLVENSRRGFFVTIADFDELMDEIGKGIFPGENIYQEAREKLEKWCNKCEERLSDTSHNTTSSFAEEELSDGKGAENTKQGAEGAHTPLDYFFRAYEFAKQKDYDRAIENYTKAIELNPEYAAAYNNRGCVYDDKGEHDKAIADYNKAIELDPNNAIAYNNRGNAYAHKGEYDKAFADYDKAIELDPKYANAYYNCGNAYADKGEYDAAIENYTKAIELGPNDAAAYNNRGVAYKKMGKLREALADYEMALKIDSDYKKAKENRDRVLELLREKK